jgi:hypothetical protein
MINQQVTASLSIAALLYLGSVTNVTGSAFTYGEVEAGTFSFEEISHSPSEAVFVGTLFEPLAEDIDDEVSYEAFARLAARTSHYGSVEGLPQAWKGKRPHFDAAYLRDLIEDTGEESY